MPIQDRLSVIIPTRDPNRPLARCLDTAHRQMQPGDEVIVIGDTTDGQLPGIAATVESFGPQFHYYPFSAEHHDYGHSQVNYGMELATGDYLVFQDDDDVFTVGAFAAIRQAIAELDEPRPLLFRFVTHYGYTVWHSRTVEEGHIGGHCAVFPNLPDRLGVWGSHYEGDFTFVRDTLALWPENSVVWNKTIIAVARPEQQRNW